MAMRSRVLVFVALVVILEMAALVWSIPPSGAMASRSDKVAEVGALPSGGDAGFFGSMAGRPLNAPIVGMASTIDGGGYWLAAADGGVFAFGDANFSGSSVGGPPAGPGPVVGIAAFSDNSHYLLATSLGGVSVFGFSGGSWPGGWGQSTNGPMVAVANWGTGDRPGWWTAGTDGGVFALGDAPFYGSMGVTRLNAAVVGMSATPTLHGYWLAAIDGGVFAF